MKKHYVHADSPVDVGALLESLQQSGSQPLAPIYLGVSGGNVVFNLPPIATLGGTFGEQTFNEQIAIVLTDALASADVQPDADDTICTLGTGIAYLMNSGQLGESTIFRPVFDHVWHSDECSIGDRP